jgi:tRNA nucleotidyltransferase (CCA-adding enzyme)
VELVVGHANPDFDAYAATVAATKLFPGRVACSSARRTPTSRAFHNLHEDFLDFVDLRGLDLDSVTRLIMVDTRDAGRIGELGQVAMRPDVDVIVYDHHPPAEGDLSGVDDRSLDVGATTSILVHEIHRQGIAMTPLEASLLLLGVHEDTGSLTYPGTTAYDAEAVAYPDGGGRGHGGAQPVPHPGARSGAARLLEDLVGFSRGVGRPRTAGRGRCTAMRRSTSTRPAC